MMRCFVFPAITCDRPIFDNGRLDEDKPEYEVHDIVVFICDRGFRLVGESPLKCGIDGEWSDDFPICERKMLKWMSKLYNRKIAEKSTTLHYYLVTTKYSADFFVFIYCNLILLITQYQCGFIELQLHFTKF